MYLTAVLLNSNFRKLIKSTSNEVDSSSTHYKIITKFRMEIKHSPICSEAERVDQYLAVDGDVTKIKKIDFLQRQRILQMRYFLCKKKLLVKGLSPCDERFYP